MDALRDRAEKYAVMKLNLGSDNRQYELEAKQERLNDRRMEILKEMRSLSEKGGYLIISPMHCVIPSVVTCAHPSTPPLEEIVIPLLFLRTMSIIYPLFFPTVNNKARFPVLVEV